jgi:RNA polymerase sigma-70 factor (ECF subfamily)
MHEQALIERTRKGDREAFAALVERHQSVVFGYLRARLTQSSDAEDMTQEVFLRFYLARARFDASQMVRPWLLGIARNVLREHARAAKRRKEVAWTEMCLELEDLVSSSRDAGDDALLRLPACLESLGPSAREAILLRYRGNLRLASIGEKLRRSEGAVKLLMYRARQALKNCLDHQPRNDADA